MRITLRKQMIGGLAVALVLLAAGVSHAQSGRRVLVLHSYGLDFKWTVDLDAAIREVLEHDPESTTTVHSEVLDAKYHSNSAYMDDLASFLEAKYRAWSFDVIIATDNFALEFVRYARERLWPSAPLVFAGINDYSPELVAGEHRVQPPRRTPPSGHCRVAAGKGDTTAEDPPPGQEQPAGHLLHAQHPEQPCG